MSFIDNNITLRSSDNLSPGSRQSHILMYVRWYQNHPRSDWIDSSIILTSTVFENDSCACFMPISRVICQCAISSPVTLQFDYGEDNVLIAVPLCIEQ